jgi:hypothetical protein
MMLTIQALEVQLASLQLFLQSISRRVFGWLVGGFHFFVVSLPVINIRRPRDALRILTNNLVLPIIGALCIPGVNRQLSTLAACVDRAMHGTV